MFYRERNVGVSIVGETKLQRSDRYFGIGYILCAAIEVHDSHLLVSKTIMMGGVGEYEN